MDLLKHFILDNLTPDALYLIAPIRTYSPDFEKFATCQQTKNVLLHNTNWDAFYADTTGHHYRHQVRSFDRYVCLLHRLLKDLNTVFEKSFLALSLVMTLHLNFKYYTICAIRLKGFWGFGVSANPKNPYQKILRLF